MNPLLLQLVDSGFPAGAFAHSAGLEALHHCGLLRTEAQLTARLEELTWHSALSALPFLHDAFHGAAERSLVQAADRHADVFLSNHVARRASAAQGRAFLLAAEATLETDEVRALRASLPHHHLPVAFGAALASQAVPLDDVRQAFLFSTVRSALSAVVRLGVVGPLRAQAVLRGLHATLAAALSGSVGRTALEATSVSVWLETAQAGHDRLYSRLFQS
jgi:urease accessory protein